ncbi:MAG: hypothetical protein PVJ61_07035 [Dehalococcoidia bacterium]|jgi:hypothetical protein
MTTQNKLETMYKMRQSGTTLDRVADRFGITREGVRRLLTEHYGSTRIQNLLTVTELIRRAGCGHNYISKLRRQGVIKPAMVIGHGRTLWKPETVGAITGYLHRHTCPVCHHPVPGNRHVYCSHQCYLEANRYKNQSEEFRKRHNERVKRWLSQNPEKARQIQQRKQARRCP